MKVIYFENLSFYLKKSKFYLSIIILASLTASTQIIGCTSPTKEKDQLETVKNDRDLIQQILGIYNRLPEKPKYYSGLNVQEINNDLKNNLGIKNSVLVHQTDIDSPAKISGIKRGDIITHINDNKIISIFDFMEFIQHDYGSEKPIKIKILRLLNGNFKKLNIYLQREEIQPKSQN